MDGPIDDMGMEQARMECGLDPRWYGASIGREHWHFHRRLYKRYKCVMGPGDFSQMVRDLKSGRAILLSNKSSGKKTIWLVRLMNSGMIVFVGCKGMAIATAYPPEAYASLLLNYSAYSHIAAAYSERAVGAQ
ncbi:protein of unknown function [Magnetospirillum sp. XM-1]|nr:protein of unknown function [Magnetospirillum sp. XM-1]